ncbi:Uncharacterized protein Fot_16953 [Forsythia ovata]|uniref:Uncharacterized protein n=1 Tax=Forsythia ovata TaxID=205694 RepID=A0ABD1VE10_9LAMI
MIGYVRFMRSGLLGRAAAAIGASEDLNPCSGGEQQQNVWAISSARRNTILLSNGRRPNCGLQGKEWLVQTPPPTNVTTSFGATSVAAAASASHALPSTAQPTQQLK